MELQSYKVPQMAWCGDIELELTFPGKWDLHIMEMKGHDRPAMRPAEMRQKFENPIGTKRIRDLAMGKKEAAIVFDDIARPTRVYEIVPFVLEELHAAGLQKGQIRFIAALGGHGAHNMLQFAKKLGEEVVREYRVYNHNPYENCVKLGHTSRGTMISVNAELMRCDLKIGIGSIVPHILNGYGGGAKIILPGVASIETIEANHLIAAAPGLRSGIHPTVGLGRYDNNIMRIDIEEAVRMVGLDVKIDALINTRRETVDLFVGDVVAAHREGVRIAREHYLTPRAVDCDIVVVNAHSKVNEAPLAVWFGADSLKRNGGDVVLIAHTPEGQIPHYLVGKFGHEMGGLMWKKPVLADYIQRVIYYSPYLYRYDADWCGPEEKVEMASTWDQVLAMLKQKFGDRAKVAIYPDATIQYFG